MEGSAGAGETGGEEERVWVVGGYWRFKRSDIVSGKQRGVRPGDALMGRSSANAANAQII